MNARLLMAASIALVAMFLIAAGVLSAQVGLQPQIITVVMPVPNGGVDASGVTFADWAKHAEGLALMVRREHNMAWRPVPVTDFAPGQTVWIRRVSCYVDKVAVDGVDTVLEGTGAAAGRRYRYAPHEPPKRTVAEPPAPIERPYGPVGKLGACDAFNYPYVLPGRGALGDDGTPLWIGERAEWYLHTSVRFAGFAQPAHHPWTYFTVVP